MPPGQRPQRPLPLLDRGAEEVADDGDQTPPARRAANCSRPPPSVTGPSTAAAGGCSSGGPAARPRAGASSAARGTAAMWRSRVRTASRPGRAGTCTTEPPASPPPVSSSAPIRLPGRAVRNPTAALAARTRSRFSLAAVPNSMLADRSARTQVSSSRSATRSWTCGTVVRAVTAQSIRRTSSPARYSRLSAFSLPSPGSNPRCSPSSRPSSRRVTVSSSRRSRASRLVRGTHHGDRHALPGFQLAGRHPRRLDAGDHARQLRRRGWCRRPARRRREPGGAGSRRPPESATSCGTT